MITAVETTESLSRITRGDILKRILLETQSGYAATVATTASSTGEIEDDRLYIEHDLGQAFVRISEASGSAPEGEIRRIASHLGAEGRALVVPDFTEVVSSADVYQIFRLMHPQDILDMLDFILTDDLYLPCWTILSDVPDYDMEQSHITDWDFGSGATVAKASASPYMEGSRYLTVTDSGSGGGYAQSQTMGVVPGQSYHLSALLRCNDGSTTGKLVAWDETNNAEITSVQASIRNNGRLVIPSFETPATCNAISIRLTTVEASKVTNWDEVCSYGYGSEGISAPWWMKNEDQLKGVFSLSPREYQANVWDATLQGSQNMAYDIQRTAFGSGQLKFTSRQAHVVYPLFIFGSRNETAFSSDTEEKLMDATFVHTLLMARVWRSLKAFGAGGLDRDWAEKEAQEWARKEHHQLYAQAVRLQKQLLAASPDGEFCSSDPYGLFDDSGAHYAGLGNRVY